MPKVSICVPVYNVEEYIGRCLNSILNQTIKDIEVIVVNDCTLDNSMAIVLEYANKDSRIKIINHKRNLGLMMARYTGYISATGDYITFCDSDDTLIPNSVELLYSSALSNDADIVSGQLLYIDIVGKKQLLDSSLLYGSNTSAIYKSLLKKELLHNLCGKLFKRQLLQSYKYDTYEHFTNGEDGCLFYQVVFNCRRMIHIQFPIYNYYQNIESSSQKRLSEKGLESVLFLNLIRNRMCSPYQELEKDLFRCISTILVNLFTCGYNKNRKLEKLICESELSKYISIKMIFKELQVREALKLSIKKSLYRR